jgi:phospholipid N-methyltransferase
MRATYSPEDNKLRLYPPAERLDKETFKKVKAAGFIWAPAQKLFVAPMWTPFREDFLTELCGEIEDEDTSLTERAEIRAERFEKYSDSRAADAEQAKSHVQAISGGIPFGQPILIGHHSQRRAEKDAEKIENGMKKAVKMWDCSKYWAERAAGALSHAKYKENPGVRARRIKKLEADKRREEKAIAEAKKIIGLWGIPPFTRKDGTVLTVQEMALFITNNFDHVSACFTLERYPRPEGCTCTYEGIQSLWSALEEGIISAEQAKNISVPAHERTIKHCARWIVHLENRLLYEKTMLGEQGAKVREGAAYIPPAQTDFDRMKETLRDGVKVVSAPQLFPTPPEIVEKMIALAEICPGLSILEPSAGTGNIVKALLRTESTLHLHGIEINKELCSILEGFLERSYVCQDDFLTLSAPMCPDTEKGFDRVIMNPPFENGVDIKHIKHALTFLKPGGLLVALCAAGPRQKEALEPLAEYWEPLPEGSFKSQGTNVNAVLLLIRKNLFS